MNNLTLTKVAHYVGSELLFIAQLLIIACWMFGLINQPWYVVLIPTWCGIASVPFHFIENLLAKWLDSTDAK